MGLLHRPGPAGLPGRQGRIPLRVPWSQYAGGEGPERRDQRRPSTSGAEEKGGASREGQANRGLPRLRGARAGGWVLGVQVRRRRGRHQGGEDRKAPSRWLWHRVGVPVVWQARNLARRPNISIHSACEGEVAFTRSARRPPFGKQASGPSGEPRPPPRCPAEQ